MAPKCGRVLDEINIISDINLRTEEAEPQDLRYFWLLKKYPLQHITRSV